MNTKMEFHPQKVSILGTYQCGNTHCEAFKHIQPFQDVLCWRDYSERVLSIFAHQIQYE